MKKLLFENLGLKISAIVLSVFLWFFVTSRGLTEMSFEIPVEFKNIPAGMGIVKRNTKKVDVTLRGHERLMRNIEASDIGVIIELDMATKGERTYYIKKDDVKAPYAMSVINIKPSYLRIKLEETVAKTVMVKPAIIGIPEKGFSVSSIIIEPNSININGLESEVRKINDLKTEALDISGLNEIISEELNIDTEGYNIKPDVNTVIVKIIITREKK